MENKGQITRAFSVFTFLTEASYLSYKISYSYSTRISIVFCLNVFLSKNLFEIIILIVFSLLFKDIFYLLFIYNLINRMPLCKYQGWSFWIVLGQLIFTWKDDKLLVVTYQHCAYSSFVLGEMSICKGRWYIIKAIILKRCKGVWGICTKCFRGKFCL